MWKIKKKEMDSVVMETAHPGKGKKNSIWNPRNIQKEVHAFGYDFQWKTYLLTLVCVLFLIVAVGVFFRLKIGYIAVTVFIVVMMLPILIIDAYRRMYEQKRFADVTDYMEQVLYAFRKEKKVLRALKECQDAMPQGRMKDTVGEAVDYMERGQAQSERGFLREALGIIEQAYECDRIHTVHELLISAEERGGDAERSIELLLEDIEVWKRQVYRLQGNKKKSHMDNILSIIVAALICGADLYILDSVKGMAYSGADISIFKMPVIQISSFMFLLLCFAVFYKSAKKLTGDWLVKDEKDADSAWKSYQYVKNYDEKKEQKKSILFALPFLAAGVICYLFLSEWVSIFCIIIGVFLLVQHKFSYRMSMKEVKRALYTAFPQWMMDMALLLQTDNVQVAIAESRSRADRLLGEELELLMERIRQEPDDISSYTAFCEIYNIPEIASCMKMLYSISESGSGNADVQIANLVHHVHQFQDREADIRDEDIAFKMKMIFFYPVAGTSVKLMMDMTVGTLLIFQLFAV